MPPSQSTGISEPRFDAKYLTESFAALDLSSAVNGLGKESGSHASTGDLEEHAQSIARLRCLDECENALAGLPPGVVDYLTGVFDQITDSFLPAPLWQVPRTPAKDGKGMGRDGKPIIGKSSVKDINVILRSLRIVSAARLALASESRDQALKSKIEKLFGASTRYLDSVPDYSSLEDIEALLLLAELEYGRNQNDVAKTRLKNVISALTDSSRMRAMLIFGQSSMLIRRRNALRTALMMLHWYFSEVPAPLEDLRSEIDLESGESLSSADELFVTSQLRLATLHHRLKRFLDAQPYVGEKVWQVCEKAFSMWHDELKDCSKTFEVSTENAPINYFVFYQQYLTTRILLSKSHERMYKRRSDNLRPRQQNWTCPTSAKNDAIRIASSLKSYGQRHRFREAPLSFVNHISAAADIVVSATEAATSEDDRNAYLHILSFLCGVLKYMAEVHIRAGTLHEAVQLRMNQVIQNAPTRSNSSISYLRRESNATEKEAHDSHLWQWTRYDLTTDFDNTTPPPEPERPRSVVGFLQASSSSTPKRPTIVRQISTPAALEIHPEASVEDFKNKTPSFYSMASVAESTPNPSKFSIALSRDKNDASSEEEAFESQVSPNTKHAFKVKRRSNGESNHESLYLSREKLRGTSTPK